MLLAYFSHLNNVPDVGDLANGIESFLWARRVQVKAAHRNASGANTAEGEGGDVDLQKKKKKMTPKLLFQNRTFSRHQLFSRRQPHRKKAPVVIKITVAISTKVSSPPRQLFQQQCHHQSHHRRINSNVVNPIISTTTDIRTIRQ